MYAWHLILCLTLTIRYGSAIVSQQQDAELSRDSEKIECPNYQYKCPDCPDGSKCVYPNSGGCDGAGIPVCQSQFCHGAVCLIRALPCPEECPFSCEYTGPLCCPFIGQPQCRVCNTFVPCQETRCPDDCPDSCFYPDADFCCPKSGTPVCRKKDSRELSIQKPSSAATVKPTSTETYLRQELSLDKNIFKRAVFNMPSSIWEESGWFYQPTKSIVVASTPSKPSSSSSSPSWYHQSNSPPKESNWFSQPVEGVEEKYSFMIPRMSLPNIYNNNNLNSPSTVVASEWFYQPSKSLQMPESWFHQPTPINENIIFATPSIGVLGKKCDFDCPDIPVPTWGTCTVHQRRGECCPEITCVGVPLSFTPPSPSPPPPEELQYDATQIYYGTEEPVVCADYIIPCPDECPDECNYPQNVPCPFQHQPACPPIEPIISTTCIETEIFNGQTTMTTPSNLKTGHVAPVTVTKQVTVTTTTIKTDPTTTSDPVMCPMIIYRCPPECPDNCVRPTNVPCPNAVPPSCP